MDEELSRKSLQSEDVEVKEEPEESDPLYVKIEISAEEKDHRHDPIHNEKTEFSFTHGHYDLNE